MKQSIALFILMMIFVSFLRSQEQHFELYFGKPIKSLQAYSVDTADIQRIREIFYNPDRHSNDYLLRHEVAIFLAQRGYADILPQLQVYFDDALQNTDFIFNDPTDYLYAIYLLNRSESHALALKLLDTMKAYMLRKDNRYGSDAFEFAIEMLLNLGDYSRYQDFDDYEKAELADTVQGNFNLYTDIYVAFTTQPSLRGTVFDRLKAFLKHTSPEVRSNIVFCLSRNFEDIPETQQILRELSSSDPNLGVREDAYSPLFFDYCDTYIILACARNLVLIQDTTKFISALFWIENFPSPQALSNLCDLKSRIVYKNLLPILFKAIESYKPPGPIKSISISEMTDTLSGFVLQCASLGWLGNQTYVSRLGQDVTDARILLSIGDSVGCARKIRDFRQSLDKEYHDTLNTTPDFVTIEGWKFLYYNAIYILDRLPHISPSGCNVKLINSTGSKLTGGSLQYYEGGWKDAVNNNDGTFFVNTTAKTLSLRMTYEYGTQTKSNVTIGPDTVVFQTVSAQVKLQSSQGTAIDTGSVQYYAGAWRNFGTTSSAIAAKELLPANYSFRMTYAFASKDKQQDIGANPTVVFQTVNAAVQLQNSQSILIDQGTVQYYSGAWREFGSITNGVANKELLPNNYSFRMTYAYASKDKQQDIGANPTVVFQTVNAKVQLKNSLGNLNDLGTVQYYSGAWRQFGATVNGVANKELLPNNYSFRMTYAYASKDKQQDISVNPTVVFQTVHAAVQLQNSQGTLIDQGTVQYYSGAWRQFGTTANGVTYKELLPNNYSFRMTYAYASKDKQQDVGANPTVAFQTVNATVQLKNSLGSLIDQGTVQYYSGAWRTFGTTTNGSASKELLPNKYSFRMTYEYVSLDKSQDLSTNSTIDFSTVLCTIRVRNVQNQLVDGATTSYYSGAWRQIGNTVNGEVTKELLPVNLSFRVKYDAQQQDKQQNLSTNTLVEFAVQ